ncbi:MAG: hypothetical protein ACD_65C00035G0001 [uncultured bacterium]|nr:MAG: hypothetical protein ACD_65C00035G0001 [uncultured bacterium]
MPIIKTPAGASVNKSTDNPRPIRIMHVEIFKSTNPKPQKTQKPLCKTQNRESKTLTIYAFYVFQNRRTLPILNKKQNIYMLTDLVYQIECMRKMSRTILVIFRQYEH